MEKGYELNDVLLVPRMSMLDSRDTPDVSVDLGKLKLKVPIIASPMKGIVGAELIEKIGKLGGIGILHRFWKFNDDRIYYMKLLQQTEVPYGISTGITDMYYQDLKYGARILVIDVANGYLQKTIERVAFLREYIDKFYPNVLLVAGNVVTYEGVKHLKGAGADLVRVGIGNGSLCITRDVTGIGYPQFSALQKCFNPRVPINVSVRTGGEIIAYDKPKEEKPLLVCDGGIKTSGDMAKALAAGADIIMLGGPLATVYESDSNGTIYGMASEKLANDIGKETKSIEGIEIPSPEKTQSLEDLLYYYTSGLKSCMTYMGASTLEALRNNAEWVTINGHY